MSEKAKIQIVEDERITADHIQSMLESFGYNVTSITSTAREAIIKAKEQNPDLILMDIHLNGEMNGLEAARRIRTCFDVPLVFITALPDDSTFQQAKLTEPFGYIHKPIEDKELYATVEMALYKHKMERKLKESEQMFRSIFESTNEFIHILDKDGKIIKTNPATIQQSGYKKNEFVGKGLAHFLTPDSKENFEEHFKILRKKGHSRLELEFVEKDGAVITVDCSTSAIRNKHGEVLSYVSFQHDITKKKEIEQMKSEFVSQVSHELRSPLASIKGFASTILADEEIEKKTRNEFLRIINDESERLARLIEDLLDLSKIEHGHIQIDREKVQVLDIIAEAISNLRPQSKEKYIQLKSKLEESLPEIYCNRDMILQTLVNLISNAIKFTPEKGKVTVSAKRKKDALEVTVFDTGVGVPSKDLPYIFDKFYRGKRKGDEKRGTGLGLSIAKEFVKSHGGDIWVESEIGRGTKFSFQLPIEPPEPNKP